jgi:hypothetical protein
VNYETIKFVSLVKENIDDRITVIQEALGRKSAKSYEEYSEVCGEIKGLLTARSFITDLTRHVEDAEDE